MAKLIEITVTLGRDGMGPEATEADFDMWAEYVLDHLGEKVSGSAITVETRGRRDVQSDTISAPLEIDTANVHSALEMLWEEWCSA